MEQTPAQQVMAAGVETATAAVADIFTGVLMMAAVAVVIVVTVKLITRK